MMRTQSDKTEKKAAFTELSFGGKVPPRSDIPVEYTWDLSALQSSDEAWEESFRLAGSEMERIASYSGRLFESPETLLEFLRLEEKASERMGKLYAYATMKSHENTSDALYQGMEDRAGMLYSSFAAVCSFFSPEVLAAGEEKVSGFIARCADLALYRHFFDNLLRSKEHVLSPREEELLARSAEMARTAETAFSLFTNADMTFPAIVDEKGEETELSEERYYLLSRSRERRVRREAFELILGTYGK